MPKRSSIVHHEHGARVVHRDRDGAPHVDHNGEHAEPDGHQRHEHEQRSANKRREIRQGDRSVHPPHQRGKTFGPLAKRRVAFWVGKQLEVALGPPGPLLEAVTDLVRSLSEGQILVDIPALPVPPLELDAQGEILRQRPLREPAGVLERLGTEQEVGTCARDEADRIIPWLRVVPEVHVGVVEDVAIVVQVRERLGCQDHGHVLATIQKRYRLAKEVCIANLIRIKDADNLIRRDLEVIPRVDEPHGVVDVARLAIHLALRPLPPADVHGIRNIQRTDKLLLLRVLTIVQQVDRPLAVARHAGVHGRQERLGDDIQRLLVARNQHTNVIIQRRVCR